MRGFRSPSESTRMPRARIDRLRTRSAGTVNRIAPPRAASKAATGDSRNLRDQLDRLRAENGQLRTENARLRAALDEHTARASVGPFWHQGREMTAGTCLGPPRPYAPVEATKP
jgi:hypothetical protein